MKLGRAAASLQYCATFAFNRDCDISSVPEPSCLSFLEYFSPYLVCTLQHVLHYVLERGVMVLYLYKFPGVAGSLCHKGHQSIAS